MLAILLKYTPTKYTFTDGLFNQVLSSIVVVCKYIRVSPKLNHIIAVDTPS